MSAESPAELQFENLERQRYAATLGVWVFLGTEVMFFAALITAYTAYRIYFPEAFSQCSHHMERWVATFETASLLTSSLFMVLAVHATKLGRRPAAALFLLLTVLGGLAFLVMHGHEYWTDWREGGLPGRYYHLEEIRAAGAPMFYASYFFTTGLHSLHVLVGIGLICSMIKRTIQGTLTPEKHNLLEGVGLYWHFVDMVWVFLYPLFYLVP
ncbi:MAG: cytochrome c oxidase subunit 3 [Deltaproteobacteria bacterium]|nr:cytochrome c oxidase subunit 3 [Deltaproteobacteria bacterium]